MDAGTTVAEQDAVQCGRRGVPDRVAASSSEPGPPLADLALELIRATDVEGLLARLVTAVASATGLLHVGALLDPGDGRPARLVRRGPEGPEPTVHDLAADGTWRSWVAPSPGPRRLTGAAADARWRAALPGSPAVTGLLEVAVLVDGRLVGAVHAATSGPRVLGDQDEAAVTTLAAFAEVMLGHLERLRIQRAAADQEAAAATARERERMRTHMLARVIDAQEAERARVARDLHDQIGQALTSVLLGLHLVDAAVTEDRVVPQEAARQTAEVRELVADALRDVRRLAFELRPTLLDDVGLVAALDRLAADLRTRYPVTVEMSVEGLTDDVRLPPEVETVAYRVVQESLTNVVRHSGAAAVSVGIEHLEGTLRAVVADDGVGFDPLVVRTSLGLRGMEERAGLVGGTLVLDSAPGRGATVVLEIPLG